MRRRVLGVVAAVVVLAGLPIARPAAQTQCPSGNEDEPGPICATLQVPITYYEVLDVDSATATHITWSASTVTCGNFHGSATGYDETGEEIDDETGVHAFWSHSNESPDNCSHDAPAHPGSIVADINTGEYFSNLQKIHIPGVWTRCTYSGSASGTGPACGGPPPAPTCVDDEDNAAVSPGGAEVEIGAEQGELIIDFPGSDAAGCRLPLIDAQTMTILGGPEDDHVTVDLNRSLVDLFREARPGLGLNLGGGLNEISLRWGDADNRVTVAPMPLPPSFPGFEDGLGVDATGDGILDIGIVNGGSLDLSFGGGDDRAFIESLTKAIVTGSDAGRPFISMDGATGNDWASVAPLPSSPVHLGDEPAVMRLAGRAAARVVNVNLDGADGDSIDITAARVERWSVIGSGGADTIVAAGGAGTGAALKLPIAITGKGGADRLTGGAAGDKLNGGAARDVCIGGRGKDTASKCETVRSIP